MAELDPDTIKFSEFETLNTVTQNTYAVGVHEGDNVNFSMNSVGNYVNKSQVYPELADTSHPSGQTVVQAILGAGGGGAPWIDLTGTLTAGSTTITFTDNAITSTCNKQVFVDDAFFGVAPTAITTDYANNSITYTFPVQASNMPVKVRIT